MNWRVEFDTQACSICEVCVRVCPAEAFSLNREDEIEEIWFDASRCDGCGGNPACREHCPEDAITVTEVVNPVLLISGELVVCRSCGTTFVPERKLQSLIDKNKIVPKEVQQQCPACRRDALLDSYLRATGKQ